VLDFKMEHAKNFFFDRPVIAHAVEDAERRILSKAAGSVRLRAQRSMKKAPRKPVAVQGKKRRGRKSTRPAVSPPGSPPYTITGMLRKGILYGYEPLEHAAFIGPVKLNARYAGIPGILERGGTESIKSKRGTRSATYQPRPYMAPALNAVIPELPAMWANSIKK
jgi:hypothetical protein